ncbi:MAG TPA: hypothetical protein VF832_09720, partial [Longimicrobiales bacterium]
VWSCLLLLTGTYGQLLDYVVFGDWIFFGLVVATLFVYRRRDRTAAPDAGSGDVAFRTPGYPFVPALFVAAALYVVVSSIWSNPRNAAIGAALIAAGVPVFALWRRRGRAA